MKFKHLCLFAALTTAVTLSAAVPNIERARSEAAARWADSVYNALSNRERVAQLIFPKAVPTQGAASLNTVKRLCGTEGFGGLLFTEGSLAQHARVNAYAQEVAKVPVLITFDGEWGLAMRIADSPKFPNNMALGAIRDYRLIYRYGLEVARECRALGVHVNFAPDADVNSNPSNPVIGYRAFGEDPQRVARAATAYSLGLEDGGVQSVAKHFPGHGDTDIDSHKALPTVNRSKACLDSTDLVPFRDYIGAGCSGIMVGHIAVPALDPSGRPASLSALVTDKLLRKELGFNGLIYTDALGMKGASEQSAHPSLDALIAGADVLLSPLNPVGQLNDIMKAVEDGSLSIDIVADRCKRVLRYKYLLVNQSDTIDASRVNTPQAEALVKDLAAASITCLRNNDRLLPLDHLTEQNIAIVNIGARADNDFVATCRHYAPVNAYYNTGEGFAASTLHKIGKADIIVAAVYTDSLYARNALAQIATMPGKLIAVFMVNPYKMAKFKSSLGNAGAIVTAYDNLPACRVSAAEALFGGIKVDGRLPVALRGLAPIGAGIDLPKTRLGFSSPVAEGMASWLVDSINTIVEKGLATGAFPGCQVLIARNGNIVFDKAYGRLSNTSAEKVDRQTAYDLASVSKAIGTLPGIMKAFDTNLLSLDDKLGSLIAEIGDSAKKELTVRELLYHQTGMPPSLNVFDAMFDTLSYTGRLTTARPDKAHRIKIYNRLYGNNTARLRRDITSAVRRDDMPVEAAKGIFIGRASYDTLMHRIYNIPLRPTKDYLYSCLNFCLLMDIEQRVTGRAHDEYVGTEIFAPLGAYRTGYRPSTWLNNSNIASTEHDTFLRRQTLCGYVHDELAAFSGGVQGNAGLFGTADDIAKVCQMLLNGGTYGGRRLLSEETAALFTTDKSPTCRRGLGFDKPDVDNSDNSPTTELAGAQTFGHLGFTGTVFWVDPAEQLIFVFLTNRVNPTRNNDAFNRLNIRPKLFEYAYRAINDK